MVPQPWPRLSRVSKSGPASPTGLALPLLIAAELHTNFMQFPATLLELWNSQRCATFFDFAEIPPNRIACAWEVWLRAGVADLFCVKLSPLQAGVNQLKPASPAGQKCVFRAFLVAEVLSVNGRCSGAQQRLGFQIS